MLQHLTGHGVTDRLELVLVDGGVIAAAARTLDRHHDVDIRRVGWDDKQPVFRPIRHAWRVELAHVRHRAQPSPRQVIREHRMVGDRLAASGLRRDGSAAPHEDGAGRAARKSRLRLKAASTFNLGHSVATLQSSAVAGS